MYVVICQRVVKVNTRATEKYTPRTSNNISYTVNGPFRTLRAAEKAMMSALATHTCLFAQVWGREKVQSVANNSQAPHHLILIAREALALLPAGGVAAF